MKPGHPDIRNAAQKSSPSLVDDVFRVAHCVIVRCPFQEPGSLAKEQACVGPLRQTQLTVSTDTPLLLRLLGIALELPKRSVATQISRS